MLILEKLVEEFNNLVTEREEIYNQLVDLDTIDAEHPNNPVVEEQIQKAEDRYYTLEDLIDDIRKEIDIAENLSNYDIMAEIAYERWKDER